MGHMVRSMRTGTEKLQRGIRDGWKNIIKENDLIGDNIVHYNLPDDQQKAIESYLGVHSYPTYRLIDQEGNIINLNVDPRNLDTIENIIKQIYKK